MGCTIRVGVLVWPSFWAILSLLIPRAASAVPVAFDFRGQVTWVGDPYNVLDPASIHVGAPVEASLQFDTSTPDLPPYAGDPTRGCFVGPGWLKVSISGLAFEKTTGVQVDVLHGANGGQELFQAMALQAPTAWPATIPLYNESQIFMSFWETAPPFDLLSSAELPLTMDFSRADDALAFVRSYTADENMYEVQFDLTLIPEPGSMPLLAGGVLIRFLVSFARRRRDLR
jgi:hypothetical protein